MDLHGRYVSIATMKFKITVCFVTEGFDTCLTFNVIYRT